MNSRQIVRNITQNPHKIRSSSARRVEIRKTCKKNDSIPLAAKG